MVEAARIAYRDYPTVVNEIPESGIFYDNKKSEYAKMDSSLQKCQKAIGGSSDSAQLAQSYMWDKIYRNEFDDDYKQLYEDVVILAVLAQCAIDSTKREYAVDVNEEIKRIRNQSCMKRQKDYPRFMKWTHEIAVTKNGKERPQEEIKQERNRIKRRIDEDIVCPMNWLQDCLDKIQGSPRDKYVDTKEFFIKIPGKAHSWQMSKIRQIIEDYDAYTRRLMLLIKDDQDSDDLIDLLCNKSESVLAELSKLKISKYTMNRLIGSVLGIDWGVKNKYKHKITSKYTRKMLNLLYKTNKEGFLNNFVKQGDSVQEI